MFRESVEERANDALVPVIEALGYEVVELTCKKQGKTLQLSVYIHKKGGVTLDDCERVSHALDAPLEELDLTSGAKYFLNVSSPGLDRPIVTMRDYERNLGETLEADIIAPLGKKNKIVGKLAAHTEEDCTLETADGTVILEKTNIRLLQAYIDMKRVQSTVL